MNKITIPAGTENCMNYLLEKGIDVERQCLQGHCGSCRSTLLSGSVQYQEDPMAWLEEGQFLPCLASAESDLIIILD